MIVQTIEISLSKGRAPDLLAHVAETGREIEMIPDVAISADDYTAEIDTVKPDGTFTMTNCTIDADGHIIAPIVEQAVAVKGLCHYIIKIYNDDVIVYSACGSLWVDDHLITDDMIESVAEVNGYRFPQDFPTFDDLPTTADFIDDNIISNDKSWSSDKIAAELLHVYSTNEKVVGTWINGETVYEKSYEVTGINSDNSYVLEAGFTQSAIKLLPGCSAVLRTTGTYNTDFALSTLDSDGTGLRIYTNINGLNFSILNYLSHVVQYGVCSALVTVRYIKTS